MKKHDRSLSFAAALLLLFAVPSFAAEAPSVETLSAQAAPSVSEEQNDAQELEHPWSLDPLLQQPTLTLVGHAECNDFCYAQAVLCQSGCAPGDTACLDACAQAEVCCNCDCGALHPAVCAFKGC